MCNLIFTKQYGNGYKTKNSSKVDEFFSTTYGIRTRDSSVKGRRLNPLTNAAYPLKDGKDNGSMFFSQIFYNTLLNYFFPLALMLNATIYQTLTWH